MNVKILDALADCYLFLLARRKQRASKSKVDSLANTAEITHETRKDQSPKQAPSDPSPNQKPDKQNAKS